MYLDVGRLAQAATLVWALLPLSTRRYSISEFCLLDWALLPLSTRSWFQLPLVGQGTVSFTFNVSTSPR